MKKLVGLIFLMVAVGVVGCGDGSDDDARNVSGTWTGALTKTRDTCAVQSPTTITVRHNVGQNGDAVTLSAESGVQFIGNIVGLDGFSVDAVHTTLGAPNCQDDSEISYDDINDDDDRSASITLQIVRTCTGQPACQIDLSGTVAR